jgi:hypothetical protein
MSYYTSYFLVPTLCIIIGENEKDMTRVLLGKLIFV